MPNWNRRGHVKVTTRRVLLWCSRAGKGYVVARISVEDAAAFAEFPKLAGPAIEKHGGRALVMAPAPSQREAAQGAVGLLAVIEFDGGKDAAKAFWESPEYTAARAVREGCSKTDLLVVQGVDA